MKKAVFWVVLAMAAAAWGGTAGDAVPRGISYQGVLSDPVTGPLTGGQSASFRIFADASGGDAVWHTEQNLTCDSNGLFHVWLSDSDDLLNAFSEPQRLLEVQVNGHGDAIAPRMAFTAVPQAVLARYARQSPLSFAVTSNLTVSNSVAVADAVQFDAGASFGSLDVEGDAAWQDTNSCVQVTGEVVAESFEGDGIAPVGSIVMWMDAANIPAGWALCDGQDGRPELINRFPVGVGTNPDGNTYALGEKGGEDAVKLGVEEMPAHSHSYTVASTLDFRYSDGISYDNDRYWWHETPDGTTASAGGDGNGNTQAHENRPPYLAVCFIIRVE